MKQCPHNPKQALSVDGDVVLCWAYEHEARRGLCLGSSGCPYFGPNRINKCPYEVGSGRLALACPSG